MTLAEQGQDAPPVEMVTLTIDDQQVSVPKGTLVIRAAELIGVQIPRFCDHPLLDPVGACRQCLVEVEGQRKPLASCTTTVTPDMVVRTQHTSVAADKAQHGVMELLLINHPLDCPVCDKGGECPLQNQAMSNGRTDSRFEDVKRTYPKPINLSAQVLLDRERCVLCARCTRFSNQVAGDPFIELLERGALQQVGIGAGPDGGDPFDSYFSGNTVQICPVGALTATPYRFKARPWDLEEVDSTCAGCAVGCRITVQSSRNQLLRYNGVDSDAVNWSWLCDKGRYGFETVNSEDRLGQPLLRQGDHLEPARWSDALAAASRLIADGLGRGGADGFAVLGGSRLTNEAAYAWVKLAKGVVGSDNVDAQLGDGLPAEAVLGLPRATINDACRPGGTIILLGPDPKETLGALYIRLKHAVVEDGAKLIEITPQRTGLARYAAASHVVVSMTGDPHGNVDVALAKLGRVRRVTATVPNFLLALAVVAQSDLIAAVPRGAAMHDVSGTSGAAPVWAAVMRHLHAREPSHAPRPPAGVVAQRVDFGAVEAARSEWFIAGTQQSRMALDSTAPAVQSPRIVSPSDGTIIALDPDIPPQRQRLSLAAHGHAVRWLVDGREFARGAQAQWLPWPGRHRLQLADTAGRVVDEVRVEVRGAGLKPVP